MPIQKSVTTSFGYGVDANFWVLRLLAWDNLKNTTDMYIDGFLSEDDFKKGATPFTQLEETTTGTLDIAEAEKALVSLPGVLQGGKIVPL